MNDDIPTQGQVQQRTISLAASWALFAFSIVINSMGNVLTLVTHTFIPNFLVQHIGQLPKTTLGLLFSGTSPLPFSGHLWY